MTLPPWPALSDEDKHHVVAFLRKVEDDGVAYAGAEYPPAGRFAGTDPDVLFESYRDDYEGLSEAEFFRLFEFTTQPQ